MKKKELLSPVGNYESLIQAVQNGADAVYLSGKKFGARAFAENFTNEELVKAIKYCHLYKVRIYVTINTIIYESELDECIDYIRFLHQNNVDAIIMQDLGLIELTRKKFPNIEIHASTQMHNHNIEQLKILERLGVKRAILARELTIDEINDLEANLELEVFIHGALCISYSGQCLFSSLLKNRSGNRGSCAGICRLPFELLEEDKKIETSGSYLLSTKEFSSIRDFKRIMQSNITSLKIEGRMKSPYYVGFITRIYRNLIDNYYAGKKLTITEDEIKKMRLLYNRGFTRGFLFEDKNEKLMNIKHPNHQGIVIGEVLEITSKRVKLKLNDELNQEDGIRFESEDKGMIVNYLYNEKNLLINSAKANDIVYVLNKVGLKKTGKVLKTIDHKLEQELNIIPQIKIGITCAIIAKLGKRLSIAISDGENKVAISGEVVEKAENMPTSKEDIEKKVIALGNTPYFIRHIKISSDEGIFVSMSKLKKLRRELIEQLTEKRENKPVTTFLEQKIVKKENKDKKTFNKVNLHISVKSEEQLKVCLEEKVESIYIDDLILYEKYKKRCNIYLKLKRVMHRFPEFNNEKLLIKETGSLYRYGFTNEVVTDYFLNVVNSYNFNFLDKLNAKRIILSLETKLNDVMDLCKYVQNRSLIEIYLYGRPEVMIMKHCPLNMLVNKEKICNICTNQKNYYLKDLNNNLYPMVNKREENHLTHIFYYKSLDKLEDLKKYQKLGINNFRLEFYNETKEQMKMIIRKARGVNF